MVWKSFRVLVNQILTDNIPVSQKLDAGNDSELTQVNMVPEFLNVPLISAPIDGAW